MNITQLRQKYHQRICEEIIRITKGTKKRAFPNFADGDSKPSVDHAWGIVNRLACAENTDGIKAQTVGRRFELVTKDFLEEAFVLLKHLRPGQWEYSTNGEIAKFDQYEHLAYIAEALNRDKKLASAFGGDYLVRSDIVVSRWPISDEEINQAGILEQDEGLDAKLTPLRMANFSKPRRTLPAVVSCKWTIHTDRAQNTRTEVLNLIRNRKGHLPRIVAVIAEPWPARIAALALGTGDLDCVYHFALRELVEASKELKNQDSLELLDMMIEGRRLRNISDLPFDLVL
ncbi:MAG: NgoMIV family type II restriction endonuclease [Caldilineaceae bacterium]